MDRDTEEGKRLRLTTLNHTKVAAIKRVKKKGFTLDSAFKDTDDRS